MSDKPKFTCGMCQKFSEYPEFIKEMPPDPADGWCSALNCSVFKACTHARKCEHFSKLVLKVRPRRLCDFCERGKRMNSEEVEHDLKLVKLTPLPAINLTSGETEEPHEKPYYAMFLYTPDRTGEAATFPVKYCPVCGRKLGEKI